MTSQFAGTSPLSALVLCAGLGTRLRPLSDVRAKAAVPIAGQPLISRILSRLERAGVRDVVINLHHLPETITKYVGDGAQFGLNVRYSWESRVLGSAGGPRQALPLLPSADFLIVNGDTLPDVDLLALEAAHRESGALVTMAVMENRWPGKYGGVVTDSKGIVHGFVPRGPGYHFVGVQLVHPSVFASVEFGARSETTSGIYKQLIAERPGTVRAFLWDGEFVDVGSPDEYRRIALSIGAAEGSAGVQIGAGSRIDPTATVAETIVWDRVEVGAHASLYRCVVADDVIIPPGTRLSDAAIVQRNGELFVTDMTHG